MREVNIRTLFFAARWFLVGSLALLGAYLPVSTVSGQSNPKTPPSPEPRQNPFSDYSLGTMALTIKYETKRNDNSRVSILQNGARASRDQKLIINWQTSSGVPPAEGVLVAWTVTYRGLTKKFTTTNAVMRDKDKGSYPLDPTELAKKLIDWIKNRLPRDFDPNTVIVLDGPVVVTVNPILPANIPPAATPPTVPKTALKVTTKGAAKDPTKEVTKDSAKDTIKDLTKDASGYQLGTETRTTNDLTITLTPG